MTKELQELIDKLIKLENQLPNDYELGSEVRILIRKLKSE